jgi:hypothetical protein
MLPIIPSSITAQARPTTSESDSDNSLPPLLERTPTPPSSYILPELPRRNRGGRSTKKYPIKPSLSGRRLNYLNTILESLHTYRWSAKNFIEMLVLARKRATTAFIRDLHKDQELVEAIGLGQTGLRAELIAVGNLPLFYQYQHTNIRMLDQLTEADIRNSITMVAPGLVGLLNGLCAPLQQPSREIPTARLISILSIMCFTQRPKTCDNLQAHYGIELNAKGVKKDVLSITNRLGSTCSYDTVQQTIQGLKTMAISAIKAIGEPRTNPIDPFNIITVYDNCELPVGVRRQSTESKKELYSMTTALAITNPKRYPLEGLWQSMLHPTVPLRIEDIMEGAGNSEDSIALQITTAFGFRALQKACPEEILSVYGSDLTTEDRPPQMPRIDVLSPEPTPAVPLMPINIEEKTNQGNIDIHTDIFLKQYGLSEGYFLQRPVCIVIGDQLTTARCRSIKYTGRSNTNVFKTFQHVVTGLGLFHLQMRLASAINKAFYHDDEKGLTHPTYLRFAREKLGRKHVSPKSGKYTDLSDFLIDIWNALFLAEASNQLHLPSEAVAAVVKARLKELTPEALNDLLRQCAIALRAPPYDCTDLLRRDHLLFIQHAETFLQLKEAIKFGDVGLLRRVINRCILLFHGSGNIRYARECLYFKHVTDTEASEKVLRDALLAACFVNTRGKKDSFLSTDLRNEHYNERVKDTWKLKGASKLSLQGLLEYCTLNGIYFNDIHQNLIRLFGIRTSGHHPEQLHSTDLHLLADLYRSSLAFTEGRKLVDWKPSVDCMYTGFIRLSESALDDYNKTKATEGVDEDDLAAAMEEAEALYTGFGEGGEGEDVE